MGNTNQWQIGVRQPITWQTFLSKLHENEKKLDQEGARLTPLPGLDPPRQYFDGAEKQMILNADLWFENWRFYPPDDSTEIITLVIQVKQAEHLRRLRRLYLSKYTCV